MVYNAMNGPRGESGGGGMMMMMALAACCCFCICILGAGFMFKDQIPGLGGITDTGGDEDLGTEDTTGDVADATVAPVTTNMDGAKLLTVGGKSMKVSGKCGQGKISFSESKNDKWLWKLHRAGDWNSIPYYTVESFYKSFNQACPGRFLTAPTGCNGPPTVGKAEFGPRQYWLFVGDATSGFQLRSLACAKGRYPNSFLMQAAQKGKKMPFFSPRSGSTFSVDAENTA